MTRCNVIVVYDPERAHVLMCRRRKAPYQGMLNFVGGKIEPGEEHLTAAYRELEEETSIPGASITLRHIMNLHYPLEHVEMEVYAGVLAEAAEIAGEENELLWVPTDADFTDNDRFAGYGNVYHILSYLDAYWDDIFGQKQIQP